MQERIGVIAGNPLVKWERPETNEGLIITPQIAAFEYALKHAAGQRDVGKDVHIGLNLDHAGVLRNNGFIADTDHAGKAVTETKKKSGTTLSVLIPEIRDTFAELVRDSGFELTDIRILSEGVARATVSRWGPQAELPGLYFRTATESCVDDACVAPGESVKTGKPKVNCKGIAAAQIMNMARVTLKPAERKIITGTTPHDSDLAENGSIQAVYLEEGTRVSPDVQIQGIIAAYELGLRFGVDLIMMRGQTPSKVEFYFDQDDSELIISPRERTIPMTGTSGGEICTMRKQ